MNTGKEVIPITGDVPAIANDRLIDMANMAEQRVAAVVKIKQVAISVTNALDWVDQNGKPYLQASGAEKIARLFDISWRLEEPVIEVYEDGHFSYSEKGEFSLPGAAIEAFGTRSSADGFFTKGGRVAPEEIDKGDVKKSAITNCLGNGITRLLGIRNMTYDDLYKYAKIKREDVPKVEYKTAKPPVKQPQEKKPEGSQAQGAPQQNPSVISEAQRKRFYAIAKSSDATDDQIKDWLCREFGFESSKDITLDVYEDICTRVVNDLKKM